MANRDCFGSLPSRSRKSAKYLPHYTLEVLSGWGLQMQGIAGDRVGKVQIRGSEHQAALAEAFGEVVVVPGAAVVGVADDGVADVLHMPAQLVLAAGKRVQGHQAVATGGKALDLYRQLRGQIGRAHVLTPVT